MAGDGSYDLQLNRFLRELPSWGVRAENSVLGYARDVMLCVRFLETSRHGKPIWVCDGDDLRAYKRVRLWCGGPGAVSVGTWNRSVAALDKWVAWSLDAGLLKRAPFRYVDKAVMTPAGPRRVHVNAEMEQDPEDEPLRFVSFEDYEPPAESVRISVRRPRAAGVGQVMREQCVSGRRGNIWMQR
nr:site-specific integrase [Streptomyces sp. SID5476]